MVHCCFYLCCLYQMRFRRVKNRTIDECVKQIQQCLIELQTEVEHLLLTRYQMVENDKIRNRNKEALTALTPTTKSSAPSPFESAMNSTGKST